MCSVWKGSIDSSVPKTNSKSQKKSNEKIEVLGVRRRGGEELFHHLEGSRANSKRVRKLKGGRGNIGRCGREGNHLGRRNLSGKTPLDTTG